MVVDSHLVVHSPTPHQGSVLGPVAESRLGQIIEAAHFARLRTLKPVVATQKDYLAGPEEQIRQLLLDIREATPRHEKGDFELRTETFDCLYGERGSMDTITVGEMSLLPTVLKPINGSVELHEMGEKERQARKREPRVLTNFSGEKYGIYVQEDGEPRKGETLSDRKELAKANPEKLIKDQFAKNVAALEEARKFQRSAEQYWKFCVEFEFPKVCDQEAMEKAAEHLIKTLPSEHLKALVNDAIDRGLVETVFDEFVHGDDISFVRQQDMHLASHYAKPKRKVSQPEYI